MAAKKKESAVDVKKEKTRKPRKTVAKEEVVTVENNVSENEIIDEEIGALGPKEAIILQDVIKSYDDIAKEPEAVEKNEPVETEQVDSVEEEQPKKKKITRRRQSFYSVWNGVEMNFY